MLQSFSSIFLYANKKEFSHPLIRLAASAITRWTAVLPFFPLETAPDGGLIAINGHRILGVCQGRLRIAFPDGQYSLTPGHLLLAPGGNCTRWLPEEEGTCLFAHEVLPLQFAQYPRTGESAALLQGLSQYLVSLRDGERSVIGKPLPIRLVDDFEAYQMAYALTEGMLSFLKRSPQMGEHVLAAYHNLFATFLLDLYGRKQTNTGDYESGHWIEKVRWQIDTRYTEPLRIEKLAMMVGLSQIEFSRAFTREVGLTPRRYLTHTRLQAAADLLTSTQLPVKEVARRTGFRQLSNFYRDFQQTFHFSPNEYRQSAQH